MEQVSGFIEKITFQNPETGFTIAQLQIASRAELTCIVGTMPALQPGETVRCFGNWKKHLIYGQQFVVESHQVEAPSNILGIKKYLGSGLIKGIGPAFAGRIVDKFGVDTLHIIDHTPERLLEVDGVGPKRVECIKECWQAQHAIRDVMVFLQSYRISPAFAQKIYKTYGNKSIEVVKQEPYRLARDVHGVGFKTADHLASELGIAKESPQRIEAGIEFVLSNLSDEGHVCYPEDELLKEAAETLEVDVGLVQKQLQILVADSRVEKQDMVYAGVCRPFIWSKPFFISESGIAREICRLQRSPCALRAVDVPKALLWVQEQLKIKLAENQLQAVAMALNEKIQIITGGPGTGKSTITKAILGICDKLTTKVMLCAPTGRAAKRMSEITGRKATTIHSLLKYDFKIGGFKHNRQNPLDCDLLIIDEASMIDTILMYSLLKAIPDRARVIFVGDINQLPSVGAGNVLKDLIASQCLTVTILNEIFRQAAGSRIITNAHKINQGIFPEIDNAKDSDFFFIESIQAADVLKDVVALVTQRLPKKYGFDPLRDIQVLAPMKRGQIGTENFNIVLQQALNPKDNPLFRSGNKFLVGDKVMQIKNDHKREVYNGDIGIITKINMIDQEVVIQFDENEVVYDFSDLDEVVLAYAVSVHKYQGSECPCIVMPIHTSHFKLLHRNLLYTGVTRGKKIVILVGMKKALAIAVRNDEVKRRYTGLLAAMIESHTPHLSVLR